MEETLPRELKNIGDKIVQKCHGLPLAIQVAAGMLKAKERSESIWNEVLEKMGKGGENESLKILDLSYEDLPTKLKPFFLYFGIFPLNSEIYVSELIRFWVAEKLIQVDESRKAREIVEAYIDKLIARNLIQVSRRTSGGRVKTCGIQNLLHDLCTRKAEEIKFFSNWNNLRNADVASTARRVITNSLSRLSDQNILEDLTVPKKLRALLCFGKCRELTTFIKSYASELGFLRLLTIDIENIAINVPAEIEYLSGLISLKLKGQFLTIPRSIGRMKKLETLEIISREVPDSVLRMKHLKHLFVSGVMILNPKTRDRQHELEVDSPNLETLDFDYQYGYHLTRNSFKKLPSMKKLKICGARKQTLEDLSDTTPLLPKLEELKLQVDSIRTSDIHNLNLSRYENLRTLYVFFDSSSGFITCSFVFPKNLVKITLGGIDIQDRDPLEKLRDLSSLEIIKLKNCIARTIDFSGHGNFPQLQKLMLWDTKFQQLLADEKGMPKLNKFMYKPHQQQPLNTKVPEKLKRVQVKTDNHDVIGSSTSSKDGSWAQIRTLWGGFEVIKRVLEWMIELAF
ncbi:hypothetical protein CDL12_15912 [Handroanthus impetiginosus]|uniref:Uncharacterized protein n=1 Tax=Handroanthus impetiginosus TaxID=429701 RepID=A0A2G9H2F9_9LAMI|nr:hypothetical protein CDL12_15912 [Handroanthus impetiginosus]